MSTKITTVAYLGDDLVQAWLQHLRDFDVAHPGECHFRVLADSDLQVDQVNKIFDAIEPALPVRKKVKL